MRGVIDFEFDRNQATLTEVDYFTPTKTEELRALLTYDNIDDEVFYSIQIEEAVEQNTPPITFNEIILPYNDIVGFDRDYSTYYQGQFIKGYKFTLTTDATVYFYGNNTFYGHQPSMYLDTKPFNAEVFDRPLVRYSLYLPKGTHYVAFSDNGFIGDDYFTTRLRISTTEGEPTETPPTVRTYTPTPLITLLDDAREVTSLPYHLLGSFDKTTSALVPVDEGLGFTPNYPPSGVYFSLAHKVTLASNEEITVKWKHQGKNRYSASPVLYVYEYNGSNYHGGGYSENTPLFNKGDVPVTYWIVATSTQTFDWGDYQLQIYKTGSTPTKPVITRVITPMIINLAPNTTKEDKWILLTSLLVKGETTVGDFTLPNNIGYWEISGSTATYTPVATDDYTVQTGITGTVTFEQISPTSHTVTFLANGGNGTMIPQQVYKDVPDWLTPNTFTYSGKTISHWNTAANNMGDRYMNGQVVTLNNNLTLYAQWIGVVNLPSITFDGVTNITATTAELKATITPGTTDPTEYGFEVNGKFIQVRRSGNTLTHQLTGLTPNEYYGVQACYKYNSRTYYSLNSEEFKTLRTETYIGRHNAIKITATSATLTVDIVEGTEEPVTARKFQYRKYDYSLREWGAWVNVTGGTGTSTFTATVTGLSPETDYEYRVVLTIKGGTEKSSDYPATFRTLPVGVTPATVTTTTASRITKNSATLNGSYTAGTQTVTNPTFEYRKAPDGTWSTIAATGSTTVTANLTALTASTDYQYRLVITADGVRKEGNIVSFRSPSENYVEQTVIVSVATAITKNSATLNGTVTAGSEPITDRGFEYKVKAAASWQQAPQTSNGSITANITGLTADTEYEVRVYAITGTATVNSEVVSFRTEKEEATGITKENLVLTLYPNPATTLLNIANIEQTNAITVEIFDIMGRQVLQVPVATVIDVSALPEGVYTVKAGRYTAKIMKN